MEIGRQRDVEWNFQSLRTGLAFGNSRCTVFDGGRLVVVASRSAFLHASAARKPSELETAARLAPWFETQRLAYFFSTRARQSASKLSESGAHAFESRGSFGFSVRTLLDSSLESGCAEAFAGHSNDDLESMGLPSYQHFRPSMRRQDQYACEVDGTVALHCCFACAAGVAGDEIVAIQLAKAIDRNGIVIDAPHE